MKDLERYAEKLGLNLYANSGELTVHVLCAKAKCWTHDLLCYLQQPFGVGVIMISTCR